MNRRIITLAATLACMLPTITHGQHEGHGSSVTDGIWMSRHRALSHPTGARDPEAQRWFDQGLLAIYAFNHAAAVAAFERASSIEPSFAMAHWGVALALSANINSPLTATRAAQARAAIERAMAMGDAATSRDREYIEALRLRYAGEYETQQPALERRYADAMKSLALRYPDDPTAWTLYADALMNLNPWKYWTAAGRAEEGTEEILAALATAMRIDPDHLGANHYYIHAIEASPDPERGLPSAFRLDALNLDAGHLAHMSSHIHLRTGDYDALIHSNERAVGADRAMFQATGQREAGYESYHAHNLEFLVLGYTAVGDYASAMQTIDRFDAVIDGIMARAPSAEHKHTRRISVLLRFGKWSEILNLRDPGVQQPIHRAFRHYARGVAYASTGEVRRAQAERKGFEKTRSAVPAAARISHSTAHQILAIAEKVLDANIAAARRDVPAAIGYLQQAVALEDSLAYDEPPNWHSPVREFLGTLLVTAGRASEAEQVFREDLRRNRRNPRSLQGLSKALLAQARAEEAALVQQQFAKTWRGPAPATSLNGDSRPNGPTRLGDQSRVRTP